MSSAKESAGFVSSELRKAIENNDISLAGQLFQTDPGNITPILYSIEMRRPASLAIFLPFAKRPPNSSFQNWIKWILSWALNCGSFCCVSVLFDQYPSYLSCNFICNIANAAGGLEWLRETLYRKRFQSFNELTKIAAVVNAVKQQNWPTIRFLVEEAGFPVQYNLFEHNSPNFTMKEALMSENVEILNYLEKKGASVNQHPLDEQSLLTTAVARNWQLGVNWLLEHGANDFKGAITKNNPSMLKLLLDKIPIEITKQLDQSNLFLAGCPYLNFTRFPNGDPKSDFGIGILSCISLLMNRGLVCGLAKSIKWAIYPEQLQLLLHKNKPDLRGTSVVASYMFNFVSIFCPSNVVSQNVKFLLENSICSVDDVDLSYGAPPIVMLAKLDSEDINNDVIETMQLLISKNPNVFAQDRNGKRCMDILCQKYANCTDPILARKLETMIRSVLMHGGPELVLVKTPFGITCLDHFETVPSFIQTMLNNFKLEMQSTIQEFTPLISDLAQVATSYCFN